MGKVRWSPALSPLSDNRDFFEVDAAKFREVLFEHIRQMHEQGYELAGLYLCSEMHGFVLTNENGTAKSNYISWKDQRGRARVEELSQRFGSTFLSRTGMRPKAGLPIVNLADVALGLGLQGRARLLSLAEWLCASGEDRVDVAHPTVLAGSGLWDLSTRAPWDDAIEWCQEKCGLSISLARPANGLEVASNLKINGDSIPVFTGVGDHQCALFGAGLSAAGVLSVNIGTGSQVSLISSRQIDGVEFRPYFAGQLLNTITHIPAGRVLNTYVDFISSIRNSENSDETWSKISKLTLQQVLGSSLVFDLAVFEGAWRAEPRVNQIGSITGISEKNWAESEYLASLLRCHAEQYVQAIKKMDPATKANSILLSGGVAQKLPVLTEYLKVRAKREVLLSSEAEETLKGLCKLAGEI